MTLTEIRNALARLEARPRQSLGQNFLHDQNLARWIVGQVGLRSGDHVVEIGPGLGALTGELAGHDGAVTVIEKDRTMVAWLRERFAGGRVEIVHADALDFDLRVLYGRGPVKVVGNLPYYVSTPLIAKFSSALSPASLLVLTLQHEVAKRLGAGVGTKDYGAMSVCTQRRWDVRYLRKLPPTVFFPEPGVGSAVVSLRRKTGAEVVPCDDAIFEAAVRRGFSERRKQLRKLLPEAGERWGGWVAMLGVPETVRAEELSLSQWEKLVCELGSGEAQRGDEVFAVVDADDRVVGAETRNVVHVNNLRHRAVHVVVFNSVGEIYLQKRSIWKDRNPAVWDSSAAGHVDAGETYGEAAVRELREELGIACDLRFVGRLECSERTGWEFVEIFRGEHDGPMHPAPLEVETGAFFPVRQVVEWFRQAPGEFSPIFGDVMAVWAR